MAGQLYVVATPIGNLSDLGQRATEVLRGVSCVAAEDTRVTRTLLGVIGSRAEMIAAHRHNEDEAAEAIVTRLAAGRDVALVTDAGTPAISDPGARIVAAARAAGCTVVPIPGPSAVMTLLSASGLPPAPFLFQGFLPNRASARRERLALLARQLDATGAHLVLFEAPHRIEATLADALAQFGGSRPVCIGRELTKKFEEITCLPLEQAGAWFNARPERTRGEYVLVIGTDTKEKADPVKAAAPSEAIEIDLDALLSLLLDELPVSRVVKVAQAVSGRGHREIYARALELKGVAGSGG